MHHLGLFVGLEGLLGWVGAYFKSIGGRTVVVLVARDHIPNRRDNNEADKYNYGVVHALLGNGNGSGHAEKGDGQKTPCCIQLDACRNQMKTGENLPMLTRLQTVPTQPKL